MNTEPIAAPPMNTEPACRSSEIGTLLGIVGVELCLSAVGRDGLGVDLWFQFMSR